MNQVPRRRRNGYFPPEPGAPAPVVVRVIHRVRFSDVDPMGVLWHGRFSELFEQANEEIGRRTGLGYGEFKAHHLAAPIVQFHVDFFAPVRLGELVTIVGRMVWTERALMNIEYEILNYDGSLAAAGYTVQMFIDREGLPLMSRPALMEKCCTRWLAGEFGNEARGEFDSGGGGDSRGGAGGTQ